jgi:hypothetical protein
VRRASRWAGASGAGLLLLGLAAAGCAVAPPLEPEPWILAGEARVLAQDAVLLRGWISDTGAGLEPVMPLATAQATAAGDAGDSPGLYVLRGMDDGGATLFEVRFGDAALAAVAGRAERHFVFAVPLTAGGAESLAAVELDAGEARRVLRRSPWSKDQLMAGLTGAQGVQLAPASDGQVAVTWDAHRFALLQARDPASGAVLAFDRDGEVTVPAPERELEIALSDGVRSAAALFRAAENP